MLTALLVVASGLAGAWFHWRQVAARGEAVCFVQYFFRDNTAGTNATVTMFYAAMVTLFSTGIIDIDWAAFLAATKAGMIYPPLWHAIVGSFSGGYMCDSKLNSGNRPAPIIPAPDAGLPSPTDSSTKEQ
jgi:hypothetical protein